MPGHHADAMLGGETYLEVVPSELVHLRKEKNCEGVHPGKSYQWRSWAGGCGMKGQGGRVTSGPEGQCCRR